MKRRLPASYYRDAARDILGEDLVGADRGRRLRDERRMARRAAQMSVLYHDNMWTMEKIGMAYSMTRERVRQIFAEYGMPVRQNAVAQFASRR